MEILMANETQNQNLLSVRDINLASLLVTLGFELVDLDKSDAQHIKFLFQKSEVEQAVNDFWSGKEFTVPVQALFNNRKALLTRMRASE